MEDIRIQRMSVPIITGTPQFPQSQAPATQVSEQKVSFQEVLQSQIAQKNGLQFSKHAAMRMEQRQIELSEDGIERLHEGMRLAEKKGLNDTLILIDRTAFIVSVKNNTVITTVDNNDLKGNVFTNIDGTVVI